MYSIGMFKVSYNTTVIKSLKYYCKLTKSKKAFISTYFTNSPNQFTGRIILSGTRTDSFFRNIFLQNYYHPRSS